LVRLSSGKPTPAVVYQSTDRTAPRRVDGARRACSDGWDDYLTTEQQLEIEERLRKALPSKFHKDLRRLSDSHGTDLAITENAAYALGVEVGRRIAGGAM